ncbi:MAG: beta-N-acetylhexosaminidase, partial [Bifidobacteriaceae bacterium]|nr:beta-N-acetylhexosaminidase [Bifidobacteriaceae bacterium]
MYKNLIPTPKNVIESKGSFLFRDDLTIYAEKDFLESQAFLIEKLFPHFRVRIADNKSQSDIEFETLRDENANAQNIDAQNEKYILDIRSEKILISASSLQASFYAVQTLLQLLPAYIYSPAKAETEKEAKIDCVKIEDWSKYKWRGSHIDPSRHFFSKADIMRFIDSLALHKMNILHFHLTDDQGWRIEIKKYPRLTEIGAYRKRSQVGGGDPQYDSRPHGGFYTQNDLREIVAYAKSRGIEIVPEIDIPGHCQAAIASYPELGIDWADGEKKHLDVWDTWGVSNEILNAEESTFEFLENV